MRNPRKLLLIDFSQLQFPEISHSAVTANMCNMKMATFPARLSHSGGEMTVVYGGFNSIMRSICEWNTNLRNPIPKGWHYCRDEHRHLL